MPRAPGVVALGRAPPPSLPLSIDPPARPLPSLLPHAATRVVPAPPEHAFPRPISPAFCPARLSLAPTSSSFPPSPPFPLPAYVTRFWPLPTEPVPRPHPASSPPPPAFYRSLPLVLPPSLPLGN